MPFLKKNRQGEKWLSWAVFMGKDVDMTVCVCALLRVKRRWSMLKKALAPAILCGGGGSQTQSYLLI